MASEPVLVLQMQRMGDIILSFPLFLWLRRQAPDRPVWVVAEKSFYDQLLGISPQVTYLPWTATEVLASRGYSQLVNLSHRPEAARLAGQLEAARKLGPVLSEGSLNVFGRWQLYRTSLTGNNRHNRFHWAELNALDCVEPAQFAATRFDPPRTLGGEAGRAVGLFVGASEANKRPEPAFWAGLALELERRGLKPVLMGGPAEMELCAEVRRLHGGKLVDTSGRLSLKEFMAVGQTLGLLVTPDTGPMHLAAWSGLKTLNLSMGPVNPWETGPFQPGHFVLRASMSCLDCWRCRHETPRCRDRFDPGQVAYLAWRVVKTGGEGRLAPPPGMRLFRTGRTPEGFYDLVPVGSRARRAPDILGELWRGVFGAFFGLWDGSRPGRSWAALRGEFPALARAFGRELAALAARLSAQGASRPGDGFWRASPPMLRPLAGYLHMRLQNEDFSASALAECLELVARLGEILSAWGPGREEDSGRI